MGRVQITQHLRDQVPSDRNVVLTKGQKLFVVFSNLIPVEAVEAFVVEVFLNIGPTLRKHLVKLSFEMAPECMSRYLSSQPF
jgi:hypothetical protein